MTHKSYTDIILFHLPCCSFSTAHPKPPSCRLRVKYQDVEALEGTSYGNAELILCRVTDMIHIWDGCSCGGSKVLGMIISPITQARIVCVRVCVCIEFWLLSAQWSCEFNLSGTINLSTVGCCPHALSIIHTWSLTSIYAGDKRGARVLRGIYAVVSTSFFLLLLLSPSFQLSLKSSFIWPACKPPQL